jgi:hypothetical protein
MVEQRNWESGIGNRELGFGNRGIGELAPGQRKRRDARAGRNYLELRTKNLGVRS